MQRDSAFLFPWIAHDLERLRQELRRHGRSRRTEQAYLSWLRRYLLFLDREHGEQARCRLGRTEEVAAFLRQQVRARGLGASSLDQALAALRFFHEAVLGVELGDVDRPRLPRRSAPPTVLEPEEIERLFAHLPEGQPRLALRLIHGSGLRTGEAVRLRVRDLDFDLRLIRVRGENGRSERTTPMPLDIVPELERQLRYVRGARRQARRWGEGGVPLPPEVEGRNPDAIHALEWQYLFPIARCFARGRPRRHLYAQSVQKAFDKARKAAGIEKKVTATSLRHAFAVELLEDGVDRRCVQKILGHESIGALDKYLPLLGNGDTLRNVGPS